MFIALVFIYKFVVVGTIFKLRGSLLFHPRRFWRQEFTVSQQSKSTPCFTRFCTVLSIVTLFYIYGFSPKIRYTIIYGVLLSIYFTLQIFYFAFIWFFLYNHFLCVPCHLYASFIDYQHSQGRPRRSLDRYGAQTWTWTSLPGYPHGTFLKFILH